MRAAQQKAIRPRNARKDGREAARAVTRIAEDANVILGDVPCGDAAWPRRHIHNEEYQSRVDKLRDGEPYHDGAMQHGERVEAREGDELANDERDGQI